MQRRGLLASAALLLLLAALAWRSLVDVDLGIHLAGGRFVAEQHALPVHDPFTYTVPDHPYVAYHWLFQLALHAVFGAAGVSGLTALRFIVLLGTGLLLVACVRARAASAPAAALIGCLALFAAEWRFTLRPELASWCLAAATLCVLERREHRRLLLLLPLFLVVWANTHVHAIGLALIACYALEDVWRARSLRTPLAAVLPLAALATLVNPYGLTGALVPLDLGARLSGDDVFARHIAELVSPLAIARDPSQPFTTSAQLSSYRVLFAFGLVAVPVLLRRRHLADAAVVVLFGALSALAVRNVALFAVVALPALARALDLLLARLAEPTRRRAGDALLAAVCAIALLQLPRIVSGSFYAGDRRPDRFAAELCADCLALETADWLARTGVSGPLLNNLALGSTLIWRAPGLPVFIDGRNEVTGGELYLEYLRALDPDGFEEVRVRRGFESVALAHRGDERAAALSARLARDPAWRLVHVDGAGVVFVRVAGPNGALPAADLPTPVAPGERERIFALISVDAGRLAGLRRWLWSRERPPGSEHGLGNFLARIILLEPAERPLLVAALDSRGFYEPHLDLGLLYQLAGLRRLALASYRHALALAPDVPGLAALREELARADAEKGQKGQLVDSVPPSTSKTLPVTQEEAGEAR